MARPDSTLSASASSRPGRSAHIALLLGSTALFGCATLYGPTEAEVAAMPLTEVLALADDGYGIAQHQLCYGYSYGVGVQQDYARAFEWCSRAAQAQTQPSSATLLGDLYLHGRGVERDANEARRWYSSAAEHDHPHAQFMLGMLYADGRGVATDSALAKKWFEKAAAGGSSLAQGRLDKLAGRKK